MTLARALYATLLLLAMVPLTAAAPPPGTVNVQGVFRTSAGAPATGSFDVTLALFDAETGGTQLHTQVITGVQVTDGLFDVLMGPLPANVGDQSTGLWLQATVAGQALPRQPVLPVVSALHAEHAKVADSATSADALGCTTCVTSEQVSFPYAEGVAKSGAAKDVECPGCISATDLHGDSVGTGHIQNGSVLPEDVEFLYAGAFEKGGGAKSLACTNCIASAQLQANLELLGDVTVTGSLLACKSGTAGCSVRVGTKNGMYAPGDGWVNLQAQNGVRVRADDNSAWRPLQAGSLTSQSGVSVVSGDVTVASGKVGIGTASPSRPLDVAGDARVVGDLNLSGSVSGSIRSSFNNLLVNGGFEGGQHALDYCPSCSYGGNEVVDEAGAAHTGTWALEQSGGAGEYEVVLPARYFVPGRIYTYSLWVKILPGWSGQTQTMHGRAFYADGNHVAWAGDAPPADGTWVRESQLFTIRTDSALQSVSLYIGYPGGTGTRYVDDVMVEEGPLLSDFRQAIGAPDGRALVPGDLAVGGGGAFGGDVSLGGHQLVGARLHNAATDPVTCNGTNLGAIYFNTTDLTVRACDGSSFVSLVPKGPPGTEKNPGKSCLDILVDGGDEGDGLYWVDHPSDGIGNAFQVYCNMTLGGGGWELLFQRRSGNNNVDSGDGNLNAFLHNVRGSLDSLGYTDSYSSNVSTMPEHTEYLFVQFDSSLNPDTDDAYIVTYSDNLFPNTTGPATPAVPKICNINGGSCDTSSVYWVYAGNSWYHSSYCYDGYANDPTYGGNYGYCHNGLSGSYPSSSLYGDRSEYNETKLWAHPSSSASYMERVFVR